MTEGQIANAPSARTLWLILGGGAAVAALLLVVAVLPAEYGIDPLGTGRALGLTRIAGASIPAAAAATDAARAPAGSEATILPVLQPGRRRSRWGESAVVTGTFLAQPARFNVDSREIELDPGEGIEIKYHLAKKAGLVYSWQASAPVLFDFHANPDLRPALETQDDYYESYELEEGAGRDQAHGTLIAPSSGIHGWYWQNVGEETVRIKLVASGFFDWVFQNRDGEEREFKPTDADTLPTHPQVPDHEH